MWIAAKATSAEAGRFVRRLSALLEEGVRVASQARVAARKQYDRRQGLLQGLAALRGEALAATPREQQMLRAGRAEQASVQRRVEGRGFGLGWVKECVRNVWLRRVRHRGRWREEVLSEEVWLASHLRLWTVARVARKWLRGYRERVARRLRESHGSVLGMLDAGLTAYELGDELAGEAAAAAVAVEAADGSAERSRSLLEEAGRRVGVLVCGMFCRLRGKGKGRGAGGGKGGGQG